MFHRDGPLFRCPAVLHLLVDGASTSYVVEVAALQSGASPPRSVDARERFQARESEELSLRWRATERRRVPRFRQQTERPNEYALNATACCWRVAECRLRLRYPDVAYEKESRSGLAVEASSVPFRA